MSFQDFIAEHHWHKKNLKFKHKFYGFILTSNHTEESNLTYIKHIT